MHHHPPPLHEFDAEIAAVFPPSNPGTNSQLLAWLSTFRTPRQAFRNPARAHRYSARMGRNLKRAASLLLAVGLIAALAATLMLRAALEKRSAVQVPPATIEVAPGTGIHALGKRLQDRGLVENARLFTLLARLRGLDRNIRSGNYALAGGATLGETIDLFVSGPQKLDFVVIPEGLDLRATAQLLEAAGLGDSGKFLVLSQASEFAREMGVPGDTLEGFLFPDTYAFAAGAPPADILGHMVARFHEVLTPALIEEGAAHGLSPLEIVTLASLIEKEAAIAEERALISAVFHNRLRRGMKLQSDPTAIYGVEGHSGRVRASDLHRENPYNTYKIPGLPPGPIANPGRAALEAAVRPADDRKVLYFVARDDSSHIFSRSYREHRRAIRRLR